MSNRAKDAIIWTVSSVEALKALRRVLLEAVWCTDCANAAPRTDHRDWLNRADSPQKVTVTAQDYFPVRAAAYVIVITSSIMSTHRKSVAFSEDTKVVAENGDVTEGGHADKTSAESHSTGELTFLEDLPSHANMHTTSRSARTKI